MKPTLITMRISIFQCAFSKTPQRLFLTRKKKCRKENPIPWHFCMAFRSLTCDSVVIRKINLIM